METKKEITMDELAGMVQRGFVALENKMDGKFEIVDKKFDQIDKKFDQIDKKFDQIDGRLDQIDRRLDQIDGRLDQAEEKLRNSLDNLDQILKSLGNLETDNTAGAGASRRQEDKLENHEERIVVVEGKLGVGVAG